MLKLRIIPTLLCKDFGLAKGIGFQSWRRVGTVLPAIKVYNKRDVDELIVVDITASQEGRPPEIESIEDLADECFVPLTVGGGITKVEQIAALLRAGADKVSINSAIFSNPDLIDEAAKRFGSQCIVGSIDFRKMEAGGYSCFSHSGLKNQKKDPVELSKELEDRGIGEILLTSIDRDGTMSGYDLEPTFDVVSAVNIPIIASGGAGSFQDMINVISESGCSAIAAASVFHYTEITPSGAKQALSTAGINIRQNFRSV